MVSSCLFPRLAISEVRVPFILVPVVPRRERVTPPVFLIVGSRKTGLLPVHRLTRGLPLFVPCGARTGLGVCRILRSLWWRLQRHDHVFFVVSSSPSEGVYFLIILFTTVRLFAAVSVSVCRGRLLSPRVG